MPALTALAEFLSSRCDSRALGLCRIAVGAAAFLRGLVSYHLLDSLLVEGTVRARAWAWVPAFDRHSMVYFVGVWLLCSLFFTAGLFTRLSGTLLAACIAYHLLADQNLFWSHIYFLGLLVVLLTVGNSGACFSLDWVRRGRPRQSVPRWPLTLLKLQVSAIYFFTAIGKMNAYFLSGEVLGEAFRLPAFLESAALLQALSVATIGLELFLALALWSRRWQRAAFALGLVFHTLVLVLIGLYGGLVVFGVIILAPYLLFLRYESDARWVVWDEGGAFSRVAAAGLGRLDWLGALRWEASRAVEGDSLELHGGGAVLRGFDALREILSVLPVSFLWAPLLGLPGLRWLGGAAFRALAGKRARALKARASG